MNTDIRTAVAHLDAPFSVLDVDAALANAQDMMARANGTPIRLASKSVRIPELMRRILDLDGFQGILAFHIGEALWLQDQGLADDIVVAYPAVHRAALADLAANEVARQAITLMVDSVAHLDFIDQVVPGHAPLRVCIDIDASLQIGPIHIGALRSPVHSPAQAEALAAEIVSRPGFQLVGVMAYEGQIAGTTDTSPAVSVMKAISARELAARRRKAVSAVQRVLATAGERLEFVNGGGTGSIESTRSEAAITEIGAGSGIIGSGLFDHYKSFQPEPAEWFVVPVVRRPTADTVTVSGGGRIASGVIGQDRLPVVDWPAGLSMSKLEGPGEVQTPLTGPAARNLCLGDHVWFRHAKAGEQTEFTNSVMAVSKGEIIGEWSTYRGLGLTFV